MFSINSAYAGSPGARETYILSNPTMTYHCFSDSFMSSGQFRIKVFRKAVTRGARHGCGPGVLTSKPGVGPRAHDTRVCSHGRERYSGRAAAAGAPSCARPGSSGHRLLHGTVPGLPKPYSAQRQGTAGSQGTRRRASGHRARAEDSRPPSPGLPHPRSPGPRRSGPRRSSRVVLPPSSPVPRDPYLAPGSGASSGRGSGTAARAAPTLPPESGVEHSASPPGANEDDVAATAPPTYGRGTASPPASRHTRPSAQQKDRGSGSHRPQVLHAPAGPDVLSESGTTGKSISMETGLQVPQLGPSTGTLGILRSHRLLLWLVTLR